MLEQSEMMPTNTTTRIFTEEKIAASTTKSHIAKPRQRAQSNPVRASRFSTKARSFSVAKEGQTEEINELPKRMSTALEEEGSCFGRVSKLFNFRRRSSSVSKAQQTLPDEVFSFSTEKSSKSSIKVYQGESIVPDDRTIPYVSRVNSRRRSKTESCISNSLTAAGGVSKSSLHLHHCPSVLERTGSTHAFSHDHEAGTLRSLPHPIPVPLHFVIAMVTIT
ncbi:hypothetical protein BC829DRAFT_291605 [Chytridium lagenaria]|nr:hypothetical protein BC829DRAFT_291605 [Chytridium lagenaria]